MNNLILTLIVLFILFVIMTLLPQRYFQVRDYSKELVEQWAENAEYHLVTAERKYFFSDPSFWIVIKGTFIYYIEVTDKNGSERKGYVRFRRKWYRKLDIDSLKVRWI